MNSYLANRREKAKENYFPKEPGHRSRCGDFHSRGARALSKLRGVKILFDHSLPFCLAHGGFQTQIEQTRAALLQAGVEVEWLRWWDERQRGDVIHYFGRPSSSYIRFAQAKGMRVVLAELLTGLGSRGPFARTLQRATIAVARRTLPAMFTDRMSWESFRAADACVALTGWEARLMREMKPRRAVG